MKAVYAATAIVYPLWWGAFLFTGWIYVGSGHAPGPAWALGALVIVALVGCAAAIVLALRYRIQAPQLNPRQRLAGRVAVVVWTLTVAVTVTLATIVWKLVPPFNDVAYVVWEYGWTMTAAALPFVSWAVASRFAPGPPAPTPSRAPGQPQA